MVHYWCETASGDIVDPTHRQLPPKGDYRKEREVSAELNLEAVVNDPLFQQLEPVDQWWVTRRWMMPGDPYLV